MKFENTEVFNFEGALRGLRNPKDSWHLSDSRWENEKYIIGEKDLDLAQRMIKGGSTHSKFMRQIFVSVDITAPRYFWSEYDTYKVSTVANSCSTMHKLTAYPIILDMFEINGLDGLDLEDENERELTDIIAGWWLYTCNILEKVRIKGNETKQFKYKRIMKQMLPEGFYQKRTVTLSYETVRHMISSRNYHQLTEWNADFINWSESLPYAKELLFHELKYQ